MLKEEFCHVINKCLIKREGKKEIKLLPVIKV